MELRGHHRKSKGRFVAIEGHRAFGTIARGARVTSDGVRQEKLSQTAIERWGVVSLDELSEAQ